MRDKLYRSQKQRVVAGVAGGLAEYFNIDPVIIRVLLVVITILKGVGILLYIILWIAIPEEPFEIAYGLKKENPEEPNSQVDGEPKQEDNIFDGVPEPPKKSHTGRIIGGSILIGIGLLFLMDQFIPSFDFGDIFPFIFIVIGAALIFNSVKK